jgi:hypothetical protein
MTLEYLREYRTYFHLGRSYGLSESACYGIAGIHNHEIECHDKGIY